jgi:deaminated glutathione amidase
VRVAVCQFAPTRDVGENLQRIGSLAKQATADGARVVVLPEASMYQCLSSPPELQVVAQPLDGPFVARLTALAAETGSVLVVGMYETSGRERPFNTVVVVGSQGVQGFHRKYMVYDAFGYRESDSVLVGEPRADVVDVDGFALGLLTCYEIRFPECSRSLVDAGADVLVVSSAWPLAQGKEEHFLTMVRARALENTVYVAASGDCSAAMVGRSHVVDPLGYQVAGLANEQGHVCADIDAGRIARARETLPVLEQRRSHLLSPAPSS